MANDMQQSLCWIACVSNSDEWVACIEKGLHLRPGHCPPARGDNLVQPLFPADFQSVDKVHRFEKHWSG